MYNEMTIVMENKYLTTNENKNEIVYNSTNRHIQIIEKKLNKLDSMQYDNKIYQSIHNTDLEFLTNRTDTALRTQEHLLRDSSDTCSQRDAFLKALGKKEGVGFDQLRTELKNMPIRPHIDPTKFINEVSSKLTLLQNGESLWMSAGTFKGEHGMMMRFTKQAEDNKIFYNLQFSNTGIGFENKDFHPPITVGKKTKYQTVALIQNISHEKLVDCEFFHRYYEIANNGEDSNLSKSKISEQDETLDEYDESLSLINKIYQLMRELGEPVNLVENNIAFENISNSSRYFSRLQIGSSCASSSIWAMAKLILSPEELRELKTEMRIKSLLHSYRSIKNGLDGSMTAKILVLDQIQKLSGLYKKNEIERPLIFSKIETELKKDLNMINPELKMPEMKIPLPPNKNRAKIAPLQVEFILEDDLLEVDVECWENEDDIYYNVVKDPDSHELKGVNILDQCYLIYHSIVFGNHMDSDTNLNELFSKITIFTQDNKKLIYKEKIRQTFHLLYNLEYIKIDKTRSGIAKTLFLCDLAQFLLKFSECNLNNEMKEEAKELNKSRSCAESNYNNMNVEFYLPEDHIWVNAHKKLTKINNS